MQPAQRLPVPQLQSRPEELQRQLSEAQRQQELMKQRVSELVVQEKALETVVHRLEEREKMFAEFRDKVKEQVAPTLSGDQVDKDKAIQEVLKREIFKLLEEIGQIGTIDTPIEEMQQTVEQQRKANQKMTGELNKVNAELERITAQRRKLELELDAAQDATDMLTQTAQVLDGLPES